MLVFEEGGNLENQEKNVGAGTRTNNKLNPHMTPGQNLTQATLVGDEWRSHPVVVLPSMGYIGMCGPKGYGFSAVLVINGVSMLADFGHSAHK